MSANYTNLIQIPGVMARVVVDASSTGPRGWRAMTAVDRSRRQSTTDQATRPDRIQALTRDLLADLDYYQDERNHDACNDGEGSGGVRGWRQDE